MAAEAIQLAARRPARPTAGRVTEQEQRRITAIWVVVADRFKTLVRLTRDTRHIATTE